MRRKHLCFFSKRSTSLSREVTLKLLKSLPLISIRYTLVFRKTNTTFLAKVSKDNSPFSNHEVDARLWCWQFYCCLGVIICVQEIWKDSHPENACFIESKTISEAQIPQCLRWRKNNWKNKSLFNSRKFIVEMSETIIYNNGEIKRSSYITDFFFNFELKTFLCQWQNI